MTLSANLLNSDTEPLPNDSISKVRQIPLTSSIPVHSETSIRFLRALLYRHNFNYLEYDF